MLNHLLYEGTTIGMPTMRIKNVKWTQPLYLGILVEMVHVQLRMLGEFAKNNDVLFRRKLRRGPVAVWRGQARRSQPIIALGYSCASCPVSFLSHL